MIAQIKKIVVVIGVFSILIIPSISTADTTSTQNNSCTGGSCKYYMLAPITSFDGVNPDGTIDIATSSVCTYLINLYKFGIYIAIGLAVLMIVLGGMQYVSTDAIGGKDDGKKRITAALQGLILALMAYLILNIINPAITLSSNLDLKADVTLSGSLGTANSTSG